MNRIYLAIITLGALTAGVASAASSHSPQSCFAVATKSFHVAATVARPQECCDGQMQCAQFLSTVKVLRPSTEQHT